MRNLLLDVIAIAAPTTTAGEVMETASLLDIARKGCGAWNEWRLENPDEWVDFSGVNFTRDANKRISFSGFEFGHGVNFEGAMFGDYANFERATFGDFARFAHTAFGEWANFEGATFGHNSEFKGATFRKCSRFQGAMFKGDTDFKSATFSEQAIFENAMFGDIASFEYATFGNAAIFAGATFGDYAYFEGATFGDNARFGGAMFGDHVGFEGATFGDSADFAGARFGEWANFERSIFKGSAIFDARQKKSEVAGNRESQQVPAAEADETAIGSSAIEDHTSFGSISFSRVRFLGQARFAARAFSGEANFSGAHFEMPPDFRDTSKRVNLDWSGGQFAFHGFLTFGGFSMPTSGWTTQMKTITDLRRLRGIAKEIHAVDAERDLFILERQAERGILWRDWRQGGWQSRFTGWWRPLTSTILMFLYIYSSDCGRSVWRPAAWLLFSNWSYYFLYAALIQRPLFIPIKKALGDLTFANAIPFGAMARPTFQSAVDILFKDSTSGLIDIPGHIQAVSAIQGIVNLILLFLIGLALRNHFKFK